MLRTLLIELENASFGRYRYTLQQIVLKTHLPSSGCVCDRHMSYHSFSTRTSLEHEFVLLCLGPEEFARSGSKKLTKVAKRHVEEPVQSEQYSQLLSGLHSMCVSYRVYRRDVEKERATR